MRYSIRWFKCKLKPPHKSTQNVVKVKLIPKNEDVSSYVPVPTNDAEMNTANSKGPCKDATDVSEMNATLPIAKSTFVRTSQPASKKSVKKNKFRRISAKWKNVRNRSLHAKFIPKCSAVIQKPRQFNKKKFLKSVRKHHILLNEDPDYKPSTKIANNTGIFDLHYVLSFTRENINIYPQLLS